MAGSPCPKCCCNRSTPWGCFVYGAIGNRTAASWPTRSPKPPARPCPRRTTPPPLPPVRPPHSPGQGQHDSVRPYQRGDRLRDIVWKKSAQTLASGSGDLVVRSYHPPSGHLLSLDTEATGLHEREAQLSRLTAWVLKPAKKTTAGGCACPAAPTLPPTAGRCTCSAACRRWHWSPKQAARAGPPQLHCSPSALACSSTISTALSAQSGGYCTFSARA